MTEYRIFNPVTLVPSEWSNLAEDSPLRVFNPSIVQAATGIWCAYRVVGTDAVRRVGLCKLPDWKAEPAMVLPLSDLVKFHPNASLSERSTQWFADPRLFRLAGKIYLSWNDGKGDQENRQFLLEIDPFSGLPKGAAREIRLAGERRQQEKNWMFFDSGEIHAVYTPEPHQILSVDLESSELEVICRPVLKSEWDSSDYSRTYGEIRGGAAPVFHNGEWVHLAHSSCLGLTGRRYHAVVYCFDASKPFRPSSFSFEPISLPNPIGGKFRFEKLNPAVEEVIYPTGLIRDSDSDSWIVGYGINDEMCAIAKLQDAQFRTPALIAPLEVSPENQHRCEQRLIEKRKLVGQMEVARLEKKPELLWQLYSQAEKEGAQSHDHGLLAADCLYRSKNFSEAFTILSRSKFSTSIAYKRRLGDFKASRGEFQEAALIFSELAEHADSRVANLAKSRLFRYNLELRAAQMSIKLSQRPRIWWMENPYPGNLGDILAPYIVEKLTGVPPKFTTRTKADLIIGSVIKFAGDNCKVWGPGTPRLSDSLNPKAKYCAVRGPLTRELVLRSGGDCPEVYGDPAWILPRIYNPSCTRKTHALGLIRHYKHRDFPLDLVGDVREIDIFRSGYDGVERFIDEVVSCEAILSTSLHGLIVAHAYGIPTRWCDFLGKMDRLPGDGTKFRDYYLSIGVDKVQAPLDLCPLNKLSPKDACLATDFPTSPINVDSLLSSFPYSLALAPL